MPRHHRFLRLMHRIALMGALLMAVAPVVSRWVQWHDASSHLGHLIALCTGQGMQLVDLDHVSAPVASHDGHVMPMGMDPGMPMPDGHDGAACDYCLLAARLLPFVLALLLLPLLRAAIPDSLPGRLLPHPDQRWAAHAARGPPCHS